LLLGGELRLDPLHGGGIDPDRLGKHLVGDGGGGAEERVSGADEAGVLATEPGDRCRRRGWRRS